MRNAFARRVARCAVRLRIVGTGTVELALAPEAAVRLGSHLAALGAESLAERAEPAA